jgi:pimeloyl-ACP methyl ester carboxylesterase
MVKARSKHQSLLPVAVKSLAIFGLIAFAVAIGGGGWLQSDMIETSVLLRGETTPSVSARVSASTDRTIALDIATSNATPATRAGDWAVESDENFGILGGIQDQSVTRVLRTVDLLAGSRFEDGALVSVHPWAYGTDPTLGLNLVYDELSLESEVGRLGGWVVEQDPGRWAIVLRDTAEGRQATLRLVAELHELGLSVLVLDLRNQGTSPQDPSGYVQFGATEWRDVEAAVDYVRSLGATSVVLSGSGTGGSAAMGYLAHGNGADISGVILEGPHLDPEESVQAKVGRERVPLLGLPVPDVLGDMATLITSQRFGIDWGAVDYTSFAPGLNTPVLLMHGGRDFEAPLEVSRTFAAGAADGMVQLEIFDAAGSGEAWNVERTRYGSLIRDFLERHA